MHCHSDVINMVGQVWMSCLRHYRNKFTAPCEKLNFAESEGSKRMGKESA